VESVELLKHKIRPDLITPCWDELLRLAASLRHGEFAGLSWPQCDGGKASERRNR
jgi:hypothetical protein